MSSQILFMENFCGRLSVNGDKPWTVESFVKFTRSNNMEADICWKLLPSEILRMMIFRGVECILYYFLLKDDDDKHGLWGMQCGIVLRDLSASILGSQARNQPDPRQG